MLCYLRMAFGLLNKLETLNQKQHLKYQRFRFRPIATNKLDPIARMLLAVTSPVQKRQNILINNVYSKVRSEINNLNLINVVWLRRLIVHYIYVLISTQNLTFQIVFPSRTVQQCVITSCAILRIFLLRYEVLTAVDIKTEIIWDTTVCSLIPQRF